MRRFGLTGGIGMGKSTAAAILQKRGVPVVDSDAIARQIVEPGQPLLDEIRQAFGTRMVDSAGCLKREELARLVFSDTAARRRLEAILHPRIRAIWRAQLEAWSGEGHPTAVAVIPLLFETEAAGSFDATVCVACSEATQRDRLRHRGMTDDEITRRVEAQMPIEKKMALADFVVWTEGAVWVHEAQLQRIIN